MHVDEAKIDKAMYMACNEAVVRSIIGIAVNENQNVGTGILISCGGKPFVLTANHVIEGLQPTECRFFVPPPTRLIEHSMLDGIPKEFDLPFPGEFLDIGAPVLTDAANDIAALPLATTTLMPDYMKFFPIERAVEPKDGLSVMIIGFPVANSAVFGRSTVPRHAFKALGLTSEHATYSDSAQTAYTLHSVFDPDRHFIMEYTRVPDGIAPSGFSGAAGWLIGVANSSVWSPEPVLVGVITRWHKETPNHPHLLQATRASVVKKLFEPKA